MILVSLGVTHIHISLLTSEPLCLFYLTQTDESEVSHDTGFSGSHPYSHISTHK